MIPLPDRKEAVALIEQVPTFQEEEKPYSYRLEYEPYHSLKDMTKLVLVSPSISSENYFEFLQKRRSHNTCRSQDREDEIVCGRDGEKAVQFQCSPENIQNSIDPVNYTLIEFYGSFYNNEEINDHYCSIYNEKQVRSNVEEHDESTITD